MLPFFLVFSVFSVLPSSLFSSLFSSLLICFFSSLFSSFCSVGEAREEVMMDFAVNL